MSKSEIHKQVVLEVTQFYGDAESISTIQEMFAEEMKGAEVSESEHQHWISYKFQMDHEIAQRILNMFKAIFGEGQNIGGGNELQVEIRELERDEAAQDYDYIVHGIPYDDEE